MKKEFEIAYENYKTIVYTYIFHLTYDHFSAEDITQEVFLKVYLNIKKFRGDSGLKTWILKIARNTYINYSKKNKINLLPIDNITVVDCKQNPEQEVINTEKNRLIFHTLSHLPEIYKTIIILRDIENMTYDEIGKTMDFTASNVKVTLFRARKKFKEVYLKSGGNTDVM